MFVIKYHAKGKKTKYFAGKGKTVVSKKSAIAFGENFREKFKSIETEHCSLVTINVSEVAEMMYADKYIKVGKIEW